LNIVRSVNVLIPTKADLLLLNTNYLLMFDKEQNTLRANKTPFALRSKAEFSLLNDVFFKRPAHYNLFNG
jgi:hypothetical protein